jgi:hypothetical protein
MDVCNLRIEGKHIIEVASGSGKGKNDQITNKLIPNSGGKEVILYGKPGNLSGALEKSLKGKGIKVFKDIDKLIEYIKKE